MSTQTDKIRKALESCRYDASAGMYAFDRDSIPVALYALSELEAQPSVEQRVEEIMDVIHDACGDAESAVKGGSGLKFNSYRARLTDLLSNPKS